jgi:hypothetical protein
MTDTMESLVLKHLRAIRATRTEHSERLSQIESRISNLEVTVAGMRRDLAHMVGRSSRSTPDKSGSPPLSTASSAGWISMRAKPSPFGNA